MLDTLKNLVFGLNEFEKARIDDRLAQVHTILPTITLQRLEDFEILEQSIYKLKEQLRIKSSNLNRVIKDTTNSLTKQTVNETIESLEAVKYDFIKRSFASMTTTTSDSGSEVQSAPVNPKVEEQIKQAENEEQSLEHQLDQAIEESPISAPSSPIPEEDLKIKQISKAEIQIAENDDYKLTVNNGKMPYLLADFKKEMDLVKVRDLATVFFDTYECQGTNIIIEDNKVLIVARHIGDELIDLPRLEEPNIDKNFKALKKNVKKEPITDSNVEEQVQEESVEQEKKEDKSVEKPEDEENYEDLTDINKVQNIKTLKDKEESLDALLTGIEKKEDLEEQLEEEKAKLKKEQEKQNKKSKKKEKQPKEEIKTYQDPIPENEGYEKVSENQEVTPDPDPHSQTPPPSQEEVKVIEGDAIEVHTKEEDIPKVGGHKTYKDNPNDPKLAEVYRDEKIVAYFKEDSKVLGELLIEPISGEKISDLNESDLSYITIFSKVFASVLFEIKGAQGTNMLWDYSSNQIRLVPRLPNDNLGLDLQGKKISDELLDQIHGKLILEMTKEMGAQKEVAQEQKPAETMDLDKELETPQKGENSEMNERAQYILNCLKRVP